MSYTDGPWEAKMIEINSECYGYLILNPNNVIIARVSDGDYCSADAAMIAAAPDMLEALKKLELFLSAGIVMKYDGPVRTAARAAIDKASKWR